MPDKLCACCTVREMALDYFTDQINDGEVGGFIDGLLAAAGIVAAAHVLSGREVDERELLRGKVGEFFEAGLLQVAASRSTREPLQ